MSYNDLLKQAFIGTIKEDYIKFITSIKDKYPNEIPLSIEELIKKYEIKKFISIEPKESRARKTHNVADSAIRCRARVWGGKESVYYDHEKNKWNYGHQCKRCAINNKGLCLTHLKQLDRERGLSHGWVDKDPPHNHYIKYKRIYGILNNIDWENT